MPIVPLKGEVGNQLHLCAPRIEFRPRSEDKELLLYFHLQHRTNVCFKESASDLLKFVILEPI